MKENNQIQTLLNFFKVKQLWDVTSAHTVNNQKRLNSFLNSDEIIMIEGDISVSNEEKIIIMAHPPNIVSDLTFEDWIHQIIDSKKGAKLDFKKPEIVTNVLVKLKELDPQIPIFLNADILQGPEGDSPVFTAPVFIEECLKYYPSGILSLGWTTKHTPEGKYTGSMIREMIDIIKSVNDKKALTVCIRVCYLKHIPQMFFNVFKQNPNTFITLWNAKKDPPLPNDLKKWIERHVGLDRVFCDLIDL